MAFTAGPVTAQDIVLNQPCADVAGHTTLVVGSPATFDVATPVGPLGLTEESIGSYVVDLRGIQQGLKRSTTVTLAWDNPVADYDMDVNGTTYDSSEVTEVVSLSLGHCAKVSGVSYNYLGGLPIDALSLTVSIKQ